MEAATAGAQVLLTTGASHGAQDRTVLTTTSIAINHDAQRKARTTGGTTGTGNATTTDTHEQLATTATVATTAATDHKGTSVAAMADTTLTHEDAHGTITVNVTVAAASRRSTKCGLKPSSRPSEVAKR